MIEDDVNELHMESEQLRKLLLGEPTLHLRTDDNFILRHLRAAEGDPQKAFDKIINFYKLKREHPEWYACESPHAYKFLLDFGSDYLLENRDKSGKRVWVVRMGHLDTSKMTIAQLSQTHDLILEAILDEPETQKNGMIVVVDMKNVPWGLMKWLTLTNAKIAVRKADSLPFPKIEYHIINTSLLFTIILKFMYPLMTAKQKEELFIHGDFESLHQRVDRSILPEEYGGMKPSVPADKLHTIIYNNTERITANLKLGYR